MRIFKRAILLLAVAIGVSLASLSFRLAWAQSGDTLPMMTGQVIRDFARITFFWPQQVDFTATRNANRLMVRFERAVNPDFGVILASLYPYVTKAELEGDRHTIIFTMQKPYAFRSFKGDAESGVDLLGVNDATPSATITKPVQAIIAANTTAPSQPVVSVPTPTIEKAPLAHPVYDFSTPHANPLPAEKTHPFSLVETQKAVKAPVVAVKTAPVHEHNTAIQPYKSLRVSSPIVILGPQMTVGFVRINGEPHFVFPFEERTAAAIWLRGDHLWVLFSKPVSLQGLAQLIPSAATWLESVEQLGSANNTLLRFNLRKTGFVTIEKPDNSYAWQIGLSEHPHILAHTLPFKIEHGDTPQVFIPATQTEGMYFVYDPEIGDTTQVAALYAADTGVLEARSFPEFNLPATAQGIVVHASSDEVHVIRGDDGIHIASKQGLQLSPAPPENTLPDALPEKKSPKINAVTQNPPPHSTLFPDAKWHVKSDENFVATQNALLSQIMQTTGDIRNDLRTQLAGVYLSAAMAPEAQGVLARIRADDLDYFRAHKLAALEGAAYILDYRLPEAELSLSSDTLDHNEEGNLLRRAVEAGLDNKANAVPYIENNANYIRQYPLPLRQRLAIIAANHAVLQRNFNLPHAIFASLKADHADKNIGNYIEFLEARMQSEVGHEKQAETVWNAMVNNLDDRQFRARSLYYLTLKHLEQGRIKPDEALKQLDKIRIIWRGDDLERAVLSLIGQLSVSLGDYWNGMKAWEELMQNYPNTQDAIDAYTHMSETFSRLFLNDAAKDMPPLKALALYNEFQELTPLGTDGNKMIENLVDRLVAVDLLDEAAARLEHQIKYRLQGDEKSVVGARLALIDLLNHEPTKALIALQNTRVETVAASLSLERNRLAAQALLELERPAQALSMIDGDLTHESDTIRMDAYWQQEDWANLTDAIELQFGARKNLKIPFSDSEAQRLLQLTLAYTFMGEYEQMAYLRKTYAPLMEKSPYKDEFTFLAQDHAPVDYKNLQKNVESISNIKSFMDEFRNKLKDHPLSDTIHKPEKTPKKH